MLASPLGTQKLRPGPTIAVAGIAVDLIVLDGEEFADLGRLCYSLGLDADEEWDRLPDGLHDALRSADPGDDAPALDLLPRPLLTEWLLGLDHWRVATERRARLALYQATIAPVFARPNPNAGPAGVAA